MTTDQILFGVGLTVSLAVGCQILASWLRIPALIVLLPVGFLAGALTEVVNPNTLLGSLLQPLVSLAVAVSSSTAGSGWTWASCRATPAGWCAGSSSSVCRSPGRWPRSRPRSCSACRSGRRPCWAPSWSSPGPTVVGPLLNFVRPIERVQRILVWEGSLIDPVGAILGALTFHAVVASSPGRPGSGIGQFLVSVAVGLAGGIVGTTLLWLLLGRLQLAEVLGTQAMIAAVVAVAAACDIVRDDTGLIAAIVMGLGLANLPGFDIPARRPFFETVIQLVIGVLFIFISATVTPHSLQGLVLPTLGVVAVLVLLVRPLVALASTLWTDLSKGERGFIGWMAPRGIVAASTAATFSATLVAKGIGGADEILPVTFLVIVMTVMLYGLTAAPAARLLGVMRPARTRPLLVGGLPWVIDLGRALRSAGLDVLMWAGLQAQRDQISKAGLELAPGELLAAATSRGAELEGVTTVLLLTGEDDFNALASTTLQSNLEGAVYRAPAPHDSHGVVAPYTGAEVLFGDRLTGIAINQRHHDGAAIVTRPTEGAVPDGYDLLFLIRPDGRLIAVTKHQRPAPERGDTLVLLGPARQATATASPTSSD